MSGPGTQWDTRNDRVRLYHGCVLSNAINIASVGVDLTFCDSRTDFGKGFYVTTRRDQAIRFAKIKRNSPDNFPFSPAAMVEFLVPWVQFAPLETLAFVLPDRERYWPLIEHCRAQYPAPEGKHHAPPRAPWYDLAIGPVALDWKGEKREVLKDSDQLSFHTNKAVGVLNAVMASGAANFRYYELK